MKFESNLWYYNCLVTKTGKTEQCRTLLVLFLLIFNTGKFIAECQVIVSLVACSCYMCMLYTFDYRLWCLFVNALVGDSYSSFKRRADILLTFSDFEYKAFVFCLWRLVSTHRDRQKWLTFCWWLFQCIVLIENLVFRQKMTEMYFHKNIGSRSIHIKSVRESPGQLSIYGWAKSQPIRDNLAYYIFYTLSQWLRHCSVEAS